MEFTCHVCNRSRPEELIGVLSRDRSKEHDLPEGTITENIRYCKDNGACALGARKISFIPVPTKTPVYGFDIQKLQEIADLLSQPMRDGDFAPRARKELNELAERALLCQPVLVNAVRFYHGTMTEGDFKRSVSAFMVEMEK